MHSLCAPVAPRSPTTRSAVTNGTRLLEGVDHRKPAARRFRDLVRAYGDELGGEANLSEPQKALVRQAAGVTVQAELMQAAIVTGEAVDAEQLVRMSNLLTRLLKALGIGDGKRREAAAPDLAAYLASAAE